MHLKLQLLEPPGVDRYREGAPREAVNQLSPELCLSGLGVTCPCSAQHTSSPPYWLLNWLGAGRGASCLALSEFFGTSAALQRALLRR